MRWDCDYRITFTVEYPLGEATELVKDTWATSVTSKLAPYAPTVRSQRVNDTLTLSWVESAIEDADDLSRGILVGLQKVQSQVEKVTITVESQDPAPDVTYLVPLEDA